MQFVQRFIFYSFHSVLLGSQVRTRRAWRSIPLGCKHLLIHIQGWFACLGGVFNNLLHLDFSSYLRRFGQPFSDGLKPTTTPRKIFTFLQEKTTQVEDVKLSPGGYRVCNCRFNLTARFSV